MKIDNSQSHVIEHSDNVFIDRISNKIYDSGLITPAIFFLEMTKPISLLGSHFLIFLGPVVNAFIQSDDYYRAAQVFEDSKNVELLIQKLETLESRNHKKRERIER